MKTGTGARRLGDSLGKVGSCEIKTDGWVCVRGGCCQHLQLLSGFIFVFIISIEPIA